MARQPGHGQLYEVAAGFARDCLVGGGSLFDPKTPLWHGEAIADFWARTIDNPDASDASFYDKLRLQLDGAPADRYKVAVEAIAIHQLVAKDIKPETKRQALRRVAGWAPRSIEIPAVVDEAMDQGLANTGVAFKTLKPFQLWLILRLARAFEERAESERLVLLHDPWQFKEALFSLPVKSAYSQREALLHLVHPDTFEPIVSRDHKKAIDEAFADLVETGEDDIDRRLLRIREMLSGELFPENPERFSFYAPEVAERWKQSQQPEEPVTAAGQRAWLVRGMFAGESAVPHWLEHGYVAIGWVEVGELPGQISREELLRKLREAYPDESAGRIRTSAGNLHRFLTEMSVGDLVVTPDASDVYVGVVDSDPYWVSPASGRRDLRRRSVEWANDGEPLRRDELSEAAYSKLRALLTVTDVTDVLAEFSERAGLRVGSEGPEPPTATRGSIEDVRLAPPTRELADDLLIDLRWLREIVELLDDKRQLILYGPPGTGKTFLAQRLARHFTADGGNYQLVQFHPSYAYEDFFEGFRPRQESEASGTLQFELVPGPLRLLADAAREEADKPFVLVIDELNRANLAKVFGELYFLLEYRDEAVTLQYSSEEGFQLPRNLFVIGTMNTADRSIALVDAAMRRRFMFAGLFPGEPPIADLLPRWLARHRLPEDPAALLDELNRRLDDRDAAIGPSYLMHKSVATETGLERIWRHAIMPLLEEHFVGSGRDIEAEFSLAALRRATDTRSGGEGDR